MQQTKIGSFIEIVVDTTLGFTLNIIFILIFFPLFGINIAFTVNLQVTAWMTVISLVRRYLMRRYYNKKHQRKSK